MALTGMPGIPPTRVGGSISDVAASYMAFGMINAALVHRFRTGEGQQRRREPALRLARPPARPGGDLLRHRRAAEARRQPQSPCHAGRGVSDGGRSPERRAAESGSVGSFLRGARRSRHGDRSALRHQRRASHEPRRVQASRGDDPVDGERGRVDHAPRGGHHRGRARLRIPRSLRGSAGAISRARDDDGPARCRAACASWGFPGARPERRRASNGPRRCSASTPPRCWASSDSRERRSIGSPPRASSRWATARDTSSRFRFTIASIQPVGEGPALVAQTSERSEQTCVDEHRAG